MEDILSVNTLLFLGAVFVLIGIFSSLVASRFGAPLLLVFLLIGMVLGEEGIGGLIFNDYKLAYLIGSFALAIILFDGGLRTNLATVRGALAPSLLLATVGVVVTSAVLIVPAILLFNLSWVEGFLLGAIVGSTDAAAVFFLLKTGGLKLRHKVAATLETESATNDPMAVFLTFLLIQVLQIGAITVGLTDSPDIANEAVIGNSVGITFITTLIAQLFGGLFFGLAGGYGAMMLLNRIGLPNGLHPLFVVAFALLIFSGTALMQGSGFLAVYIAGLILGNNPVRAFPSIIKFHDTLTWLSQIIMFIVLGLLVTPSTLLSYAPTAILFAVILIFVARPVAVWLCLARYNFNTKEKWFISWVGLRGAVSIFLAAVPVLTGLPQAELYFNVAFFVVIISLMVQGWTINAAAKKLKVGLTGVTAQVHRVEVDLPGQDKYELAGYHIEPDSNILQHGIIPSWAQINMVIREGKIMKPEDAGDLIKDDYVYFLIKPEQANRLDRLFASYDNLSPDDDLENKFEKIAVIKRLLKKLQG